MKIEDIKWNAKTILYVIAINEFVKFGITNNWKRREKEYEEEFLNQPFHLVKTYDFDFRWQAELIEQVVKWRLWDYIVFGRHEYTVLPLIEVIYIIESTIEELKTDFFKLEYIHKNDEKRWSFYRQLADTYFSKITFPEYNRKNITPQMARLYIKGIRDTRNNSTGAFSLILVSDNVVQKEIAECITAKNFNRFELLSLEKAFDLCEINQFKQVEIVSNSNYILSKIRMIETRKKSKIQISLDENQDLWEIIQYKLSNFEVKAINLRDNYMIKCLQNANDILKMHLK